MDKIVIDNLEICSVLNERDRYILSAELNLDLDEAENTDNPLSSLQVTKICKEGYNIFAQSKDKTIKKKAEELAEYILITHPPVNNVFISVKVSEAPIYSNIYYSGIKIERKRHTVYLGVGSNVGDRMANIKASADLINKTKCSKVKRISKIYETEPYGYKEQDMFLNCVFEIQSLLTPRSLVCFLLDIEQKLKRERTIKWGPRTIDLDVLFYDDLITETEDIIIPHPRLHERLFVLRPLCDIAPYLVHPIFRERCYKIMESLKSDEPDPVERGEL